MITFQAYGQTYRCEDLDQANRDFLWNIEDYHYEVCGGFWCKESDTYYVWTPIDSLEHYGY